MKFLKTIALSLILTLNSLYAMNYIPHQPRNLRSEIEIFPRIINEHILPDGSIQTRYNDGIMATISPDRKTIINKYPDGMLRFIKTDCNTFLNIYPDGKKEEVTINPDYSTTTRQINE